MIEARSASSRADSSRAPRSRRVRAALSLAAMTGRQWLPSLRARRQLPVDAGLDAGWAGALKSGAPAV